MIVIIVIATFLAIYGAYALISDFLNWAAYAIQLVRLKKQWAKAVAEGAPVVLPEALLEEMSETEKELLVRMIEALDKQRAQQIPGRVSGSGEPPKNPPRRHKPDPGVPEHKG